MKQRGHRASAVLGAITLVGVTTYWLTVFGGLCPVEELVPGYRYWFLSFPAADG